MLPQKDVVQHIAEEDADYYSDDDLFSISSWGADLSFRELIDRYEEGALVKPELQRHYVWDRAEASRFIDSLLLGLPVPSIFLAKTPDEKMLIVDGYQRIMTVHDYVKGIFSGDKKVFRLSRNEKINPRWQSKAFSELSDAEQRKIRNTTIHAIIFVQQKPSGRNTSLFQIFERINTSGRTLLPQEIRNCIYQGTLNDLLIELNGTPEWRSMFGLSAPESRMRDMEFILRFLALGSDAFQQETKERISLKQFLNTYMGEHANAGHDEIDALRHAFLNSVRFLYANFGTTAFHNVSPTVQDKLIHKFSPTIYDSLMLATDRALRSPGTRLAKNAEDARRTLLRDAAYRQAITQETMRTDTIALRVNKAFGALFSKRSA